MHLDEEQVQRLMHGELPVRTERGVREHLAECNQCRERVVEAEGDESGLFVLLQELDHPAPAVSVNTIVARAGGRKTTWVRWAAGIALFLGAAGAAYAVPGSPLRDWVDSAVAWIGGDQPAAPPAPEVAKPQFAGVAAIPGARFIIAFESPEPGGQARVSLTGGDQVTVRAPLGAASFTSGADRLVIDNQSTGAIYAIEIPRSAPRVEVQVAGRRILLKEGSRVVSQAGESGGSYTLRLD